MNTIFKEKYGGMIVRVLGQCTYMDFIKSSDFSERSLLPFDDATCIEDTDSMRFIRGCIYCRDVNTNKLYAIPMLEFMTYFKPYDGYVEDMLKTIEKLKRLEDEEQANDIPQSA